MHTRMIEVEPQVAFRRVGGDQRVPTVDGRERRSTDLDHAASTPPLVAVRDAVERFVPCYSSIHRGGYRSQVASRAHEGARSAGTRVLRSSTEHHCL